MKNQAKILKMPKPKRHAPPSAPALEWIGEVSGRAVRATLVGGSRVLIENHTGITDFSEDCVRLNVPNGTLSVHGTHLSLCEVRPNALIVRGCIRSVEMPEDGDV